MPVPFRVYEPPPDPRAFEATLRRYCVTTTGEVVVDLCEVRLDGASIRVLAQTRRQLRLGGRGMVVRGPSEANGVTPDGARPVARGSPPGPGS
jgi:hypothetical protein